MYQPISEQISIEDFINGLFESLPESSRTEGMKARIEAHVNEIIMQGIADDMGPDDLQESMRMNQEIGIPMQNIFATYLQEKPELEAQINENLNHFAKTLINFTS